MDGIDFRTKAYRRAAHTVEFLPTDIEEIKNEGRLQELPGVGKAIALKIEEIIDTGSLKYLEDLKDEYVLDLDELMSVEGIGAKTIKRLYLELGVKNLDDLEYEAKRHHIHRLKGMGLKTEKKILENLKFAREGVGRRLLGDVLPLADELKRRIGNLPEVEVVELAGSIRRRKETVGDVDILTVSGDSEKVMEFFSQMDMVNDIVVKGPSKTTVRLENGLEVDLRVFQKDEYGSALVYFTGSMEFNVELRKIAISKGLKLNEYGVFQGEEQIAGKTEEDVLQAIGLDYIEPELRENWGEVDAARKRMLPELIEREDIRGDLHIHTSWSDGENSIREIVMEAKKLGYEYIAITDHTKGLPLAIGMDEKTLTKQMKEIEKINDEIKGITVLKGVEVNIGAGGSLDLDNEILKDLDIVLAALHSGVSSKTEFLTESVVNVLENEEVDVLAHPTGRKLNQRRPFDLDLEMIFEVSKDTGTILEIDSQPKRLDLKDSNIKQAIKHGCSLVIDTDAHSTHQMKYMELGVSTARRGWAGKKDILNTLPLKRFMKNLK
jgi:DNA polymerase (family 10)